MGTLEGWCKKVRKDYKERKIKALVVKADLTVQKIGEIQITAPIGVEVDYSTGELKTPVELRLIDQPVFTATIVPDKLINHGQQKAYLVVKKSGSTDCKYSVSSKLDLDIPIFGMHDIPDIKQGDHIKEVAEVESIDIRGIRDPIHKECGNMSILLIKVVYKLKVTIAREETISVPKHCKQHKDDCCFQETDDQNTIINENNIKIIVDPSKGCGKRFR